MKFWYTILLLCILCSRVEALVLDSSCKELARNHGLDPSVGQTNLDQTIKQLISRFQNHCARPFTGLVRYGREFLSKQEGTVLVCALAENSKINAIASKTVDELEHAVSGSFFKALTKRHDKDTRMLLLSPMRALKILGNKANEAELKTLAHELLHFTSANNRHDHNELQNTPMPVSIQDISCQKGQLDDRVLVLTNLCFGFKSPSSNLSFVQLLMERIKSCRLDSGCLVMFSDSVCHSLHLRSAAEYGLKLLEKKRPEKCQQLSNN